ncbi:glycerol kinase GlpK [Fodinicurvata sp. EGI_FJ10296]|uniref:glycerol kinase GlpK n=1 Tax=Fodinicurvata sp. EGI_FJ10296 TaxID=3231908 RepID=UPI0034516678
MAASAYIVAIDQGTTSTRAIVFDAGGRPVATAQKEFTQHYPADAWVEHDAEEIWADVVAVVRDAVAKAGVPAELIAGIGITNQRETVVVWDRETGKPIHRAIVWLDRRTSDYCRSLVDSGHGPMIAERTGLVIDAYFSGSKIKWILDNVDGARSRAEQGRLCFGTIDSWLLYKLTDGAVHKTDATNASRTMLFNIHTQQWDDELLDLFGVPRAMMPEVCDNSGRFGLASEALLGNAIPVSGMAGDQQAATFGQACFDVGMTKSTYGTGCFALINTGETAVVSRHKMLTTVAYRLDGKTTYALEGSIFVAGATVKWLRDGLGIIDSAARTASLAVTVPDNHGVYFVPAFSGLGAPHWDPDARGTISGLTFDAGPAHIVRAALESVGFQTADLITAMRADGAAMPPALRVDGGMVVNDWVCQFLADILDLPVERPVVTETTALGSAYLAGLAEGVYGGLESLSAQWASERRFEPSMEAGRRERLLAGWHKAVRHARGIASD